MDRIYNSWLDKQHDEVMALAAASDRLMVVPHPETPPRAYVVRFDCLTLVRAGGDVTLWDGGCDVLFRFPTDYLRVVTRPEWIVALRSPAHLYHPNAVAPFLCIGHITPGTSLVRLIHQVHDLLTFAKYTPREDDALNREACAWARANGQRFPVDVRPLRRRVVSFDVDPVNQGAAHAT